MVKIEDYPVQTTRFSIKTVFLTYVLEAAIFIFVPSLNAPSPKSPQGVFLIRKRKEREKNGLKTFDFAPIIFDVLPNFRETVI